MMILALVLAAASAPAPSDPDLAAARAVFIDHLRDPEHAKVRNFRRMAALSSGRPVYCGEVNAPNAYGGMTGWHGVRVTPQGTFIEDPQDNSFMHDAFVTMCSGGGGDDVTSAFTPAS